MESQKTSTKDYTFEARINADIATVYNAAKTQAGVKGWWNTRCQVSEVVGGTSQMNFNKEGMEIVMVFRVDELSENARVAWTCTENGNPYWVNSNISFEMRAADGGTDFRFVHNNFNPAAYSEEMHNMISQGWDHFMNSFQSFCETGEGQPWS